MTRPDPAPLIHPTRRFRAGATAALAAGLLAVLAVRYQGGDAPGRVDRWFDGPLSMRGSDLRWLPEALVATGSPRHAALTALLIATLALVVRRWRAVALVAVAPPVAVGLTQFVLKPLVARVDEDGLVFPSGHATSASSLLVTAAVIIAGARIRPGAAAVAALVGIALLLVAIPTALAATGYHYVTDGIGAVLLSIAVVLVAALAVDAVAERHRRRPGPVVPAGAPRAGGGS